MMKRYGELLNRTAAIALRTWLVSVLVTGMLLSTAPVALAEPEEDSQAPSVVEGDPSPQAKTDDLDKSRESEELVWDLGTPEPSAATRDSSRAAVALPESQEELLSASDEDALQTLSTAWDGSIDVSWYDPVTTEFSISTPAQLAGVAALVNGLFNEGASVIGNSDYIVANYDASGKIYFYGEENFTGKIIKLTDNLDMGGVYDPGTGTWSGPNYMPIGGQYCMDNAKATTLLSSSFNGTFDGQGFAVYNIYCERYTPTSYENSQAVGFIGRLGLHDNDPVAQRSSNCRVKNLIVDGYISGRRSVGGIVGKIGKTVNGARITSCANYATVVSTDSKGIGGIVGAAWNGGVVSDCYNAGTIAGGWPVGGIVGSNEIEVRRCYNVGEISSARASSYAMAMGTDASGAAVPFEDCYWLDTCAPGGGIFTSKPDSQINCAPKTAEELRSPGMINLLNGVGAFALDVGGNNNGYPVLTFNASPDHDDNDPVTPIGVSMIRLAGSDRFATSAAITKEVFAAGADTVIIASGESFPDALAASGLAGALDGDIPVILTSAASLSSEAADTITSLQAKHAIVVGGSAAVSDTTYNQVAALVDSIERVYGSSRLETAVAMYERGTNWSSTAIITTAAVFADALSISSFAYAERAPIFLSNGLAGLDASTQQALASGGFTKFLILGGASAVPESVLSQLPAGVPAERLSGSGRYETSMLIAEYALRTSANIKATTLFVAVGNNYPDALSGGAAAGKTGSVMLLIEEGAGEQCLTGFIRPHASDIAKVYVLGGSGVISDALMARIKAAVR